MVNETLPVLLFRSVEGSMTSEDDHAVFLKVVG
jgi:hypothetical protein